MSMKHPAARVAEKFPTSTCILRMKTNTVSRPSGPVKLGSSVTLVIGVWDKRPAQQQIVATIIHNGIVRELTRNLAGEDNPNTAPDPFTLSVLDDCEIELLPSSGYVGDFVRAVVNDEKDGLVDRTADAVRAAGEARALADSLATRVDALPATGDYNALRADIIGIRNIATSAETAARAVVTAAEERMADRERLFQERFTAQASQLAAVERKLAVLDKTLQAMLTANEEPAKPAPALAPVKAAPVVQQQAQVPQDAAPDADQQRKSKVDAYRSKVAAMNIGSVRGEFGRMKLPPVPAGTKTLDEQKAMLVDAYKRQLAAEG